MEKKKSPLYPDLKDEENERELLNADGKVERKKFKHSFTSIIDRCFAFYQGQEKNHFFGAKFYRGDY